MLITGIAALIASATLRVGPTQALTLPSQAAAMAADGDTILIDAGLYTGDVATWRAHRLTLRAVGGRAHLDAAGANAGGKGTWVIQGDDTIVEGIEFSGATVPDQNGAGIRQEGANLTVRDCYFHDNENGILTSGNAQSDILIEGSVFARNGFGDGQSHNMYIGSVRSLTVRGSWIHDARVGHNLKSRAATNLIEGNRITSEDSGDPSYEIEFPNGGVAWVLGNVIQQGPNAGNPSLISFAAEGASHPVQALYVAFNTAIDDRGNGTLVRNHGVVPATLVDNIVIGRMAILSGPGTSVGEVLVASFVDRAMYDLRLAPGSAGIGAARAPAMARGRLLAPDIEYVHPALKRPRTSLLDVGAFEGAPVVVVPDAGVPSADAAPAARDAAPSPPDAAPSPTDAAASAPDAGPLLRADAASFDPDAAVPVGRDAAVLAPSDAGTATVLPPPEPLNGLITGSCSSTRPGELSLLGVLALLLRFLAMSVTAPRAQASQARDEPLRE